MAGTKNHIRKCVDCPEIMVGVGNKRKRCPACQAIHVAEYARVASRLHMRQKRAREREERERNRPAINQEKMTCEKGDIVLHKGQRVFVSEVFSSGFEPRLRYGRPVPGERAYLIVCRILPDRLNPEHGQILKNSPFLIEDDWRHQ